MKRFLLLILAIPLFASADSWKIDVGTNAVVIVPPANVRQWGGAENGAQEFVFSAWATGTVYSAGDFVQSENKVYWTPNGGTSSETTSVVTNGYTGFDLSTPIVETNYVAQPIHLDGFSSVTNDNILWKRVTASGRGYVILQADSSTDVLFELGSTCTTNSGGLLDALRPRQPLPTDEYISARVKTTGTATVYVYEIEE